MQARSSRVGLVGRATELEALRAARERAATGAATLAIVSGEAGVGKTRLTREAAAEATAEGWRVLSGGSVGPSQATLPFAPLVMALRPLLAGLPDAEIDRWVGEGRPFLARLLPEVGPAAPVRGADDDRYLQGRIFAAITQTLERLASRQPVVLVLEDIHWADATSRAMLAHLLGAIRDVRLLIVTTVRDEDLAGGGQLADEIAELGRRAEVVRIRLAPLDLSETSVLVRSLSDRRWSDADIDALFHRSGGLPFYVEELTWFDGVPAIADIPPGIRDIILAKVANLGGDARRLVQAAAVVGAAVDDATLCSIAGLGSEDGATAIREAANDHLLVRTADDRLIFRHDLAREAIYADLLGGERRRWHAAVAASMDARPGAESPHEFAAQLAMHRDRAGDVGPALQALGLALRALMRAGAWMEAFVMGRRATELWSRVEDPAGLVGMRRHELLATTAAAAFRASELPAAITTMQEAIAALDDGGPLVRSRYLERLAWYAYNGGETGLSVEAGEAAIEAAPISPPTRERARALTTHANRLSTLNRFDEMRGPSDEAVAIAEAIADRAELGHALHVRGSARVAQGDIETGLQDLETSLAIAGETGDGELAAMAAFDLCWAAWTGGDHRRAVEAASAGVRLVDRLGLSPVFRHMMELNVVEMRYYEGSWALIEDGVVERDPRSNLIGSGLEAYIGARLVAGRGGADARSAMPEYTPAEEENQLVVMWHLSQAYAFGQFGDRAAAWAAVERVLATPAEHRVVAEAVIEGAGIVADDALADHSRRQGGDDETPSRRFDRLARSLAATGYTTTGEPVSRVVQAAAAIVGAERLRADGTVDARGFLAAAGLFAGMPWPEQEARARLRAAEALRSLGDPAGAQREIASAWDLARALGAPRLKESIEAFARRARLTLDETIPVPDAAAPSRASSDPLRDQPFGLTARELEVLALVVQGRTNREIGDELFISPKTAGVHVSNIIGKLGAANRVEAASMAYRYGLTS